jgi:phosphate-selective porin
MKICLRICLVAVLGLTFLFSAKAETPTNEELASQLEGINENVNMLLGDVAGLRKIKVSGYMQVQLEKLEKIKGYGISEYDSSNYVYAKFRVRRSRVKVAYDAGLTQFVVQGDFSNTGFTLKDAYVKITDPWTKIFSLTAGVFNRPVYEVEYSSSQRESMERSKIIRTLYPEERDLGAMLTVEPEDLFKLQVALFNNTFLGDLKQTAPVFGDNFTYLMARLTKSFAVTEGLDIDLGAHIRYGTVPANSDKVIESGENKNTTIFKSVKPGDALDRTWFGGEIQIYADIFSGLTDGFLGATKILGEYITGKDVDVLPTKTNTSAGNIAAYNRIRDISGFYAMLVQNIGTDFQIAAKYDSYDPNTKIDDAKINDVNELTENTIGFGIHNYTFSNVRLSLWYDMVKRQETDTYKTAPINNTLIFRIQYKF